MFDAFSLPFLPNIFEPILDEEPPEGKY